MYINRYYINYTIIYNYIYLLIFHTFYLFMQISKTTVINSNVYYYYIPITP